MRFKASSSSIIVIIIVIAFWDMVDQFVKFALRFLLIILCTGYEKYDGMCTRRSYVRNGTVSKRIAFIVSGMGDG